MQSVSGSPSLKYSQHNRFDLSVALSLLISSVAPLILAGCTHSVPPADLIIINGAEPESLDPAIVTGQSDGRVALSLFEGLTRYNPTNAAPMPGLAERWD